MKGNEIKNIAKYSMKYANMYPKLVTIRLNIGEHTFKKATKQHHLTKIFNKTMSSFVPSGHSCSMIALRYRLAK